MQSKWRLTTVAVLSALAASRVGAQETSRVALDLGFPPALALLWHAGDKLDLRPEFNFTHVSTDPDGNSQTRLGFGASVLFPLTSAGQLTPYFGVRGSYGWYSGDDAPKDWSATGIFGGRYAIDKRFGVSAETGVAYDQLQQGSGQFANKQKSLTTWGRVSALVYF